MLRQVSCTRNFAVATGGRRVALEKLAENEGAAGFGVASRTDIKKHRFLVLDGVRGLAILGVLLVHGAYVIHNKFAYWTFKMGWIGVDLFFVLSGFLITGILIDTRHAVNRATTFYARRILRIFPIYYLTLFTVLILQTRWVWLARVAGVQTWLDRASLLFYFKDLVPLWHHGMLKQSALTHFWSLAVEEQFYLIWPLVVWAVAAKKLYKLCGLALCCSLALRIALGPRFGYSEWMLYFPLTRADGLFAGSALAALLATGYRPTRKLMVSLALACCFVLSFIALVDHRQLFFGGAYMTTIGVSSVAVGFTVLIAYSLQSAGAPLSRGLRSQWLRALGKYSYGLYVFHIPVFFLADHLAVDYLHITFPLRGFPSLAYLGTIIAASYGVAWLSFHYYEQRFLDLKRFFEPVYTREESCTMQLSEYQQRLPVGRN